MLAELDECRISIRAKVTTAISMNPANDSRKMLSTVSTAAARTITKDRMASM